MSQATPDNTPATVTAHAAQKTTTQLPQQAPAEVQAATAATPQAIFDVDPRWRPGLLAGIIVAGIVLLIALILIVAYFLLFIGPGLTFLGGVLALIPLAIVLLGVRWIDRWEPEPRLLLLLAFLWPQLGSGFGSKINAGKLDDILSTPGLDAVYVGPADLGLSLVGIPAAPRGVPACAATGSVPRPRREWRRCARGRPASAPSPTASSPSPSFTDAAASPG